LIPRLLPVWYEVRNNRGVGHVGEDVNRRSLRSGQVPGTRFHHENRQSDTSRPEHQGLKRLGERAKAHPNQARLFGFRGEVPRFCERL
jgi:hypothetical protein